MPDELPFIDEHSIEIDARPPAVWQALTETFGASDGGLFAAYAKVIGVEPDTYEGELDEVGSTRVGFLVSEVRQPNYLELSGRHRFSTYRLIWEINESGPDMSSLSATTYGEFPGIHGRAYKALVIDSKAHERITKRMLAAVGRRANRYGSQPPD